MIYSFSNMWFEMCRGRQGILGNSVDRRYESPGVLSMPSLVSQPGDFRQWIIPNVRANDKIS
jgi:hypothetical protein